MSARRRRRARHWHRANRSVNRLRGAHRSSLRRPRFRRCPPFRRCPRCWNRRRCSSHRCVRARAISSASRGVRRSAGAPDAPCVEASEVASPKVSSPPQGLRMTPRESAVPRECMASSSTSKPPIKRSHRAYQPCPTGTMSSQDVDYSCAIARATVSIAASATRKNADSAARAFDSAGTVRRATGLQPREPPPTPKTTQSQIFSGDARPPSTRRTPLSRTA